MFCPKCGSFICLPGDKCTICGYIEKNKRKSKNKKQKNNSKTKKIKQKNKKPKNGRKMKNTSSKKSKKTKNKSKNKRKYYPKGHHLGGKTRFFNQKSFLEFEVLGNNYSKYYF